ncbi:MAG: barstar family protein [Solobacterium sp.]|nr:barstar family protein [Solobacterium sp.]
MKYITIEPERLETRASVHEYFREIVNTPAYYGNNLDALNDWLSETDEDICFKLTSECILYMCDHEYAWRVLMVLGRAADVNPHIHISF